MAARYTDALTREFAAWQRAKATPAFTSVRYLPPTAKGQRLNYIDYIASRPRYGEMDRGLFSERGPEEPELIMQEIAQHNGTVWQGLISLREGQAEACGYGLKAEPWEQVTIRSVQAMAKAMGLKDGQYRWVAACHLERGHPHAHIALWQTAGRQRAKWIREDQLTRVREVVGKQLLAPMAERLYQQRAELRQALRQANAHTLGEMLELARNLRRSPLPPGAEVDLAERLNGLVDNMTGKGRRYYRYLEATQKGRVDEMADRLLAHPSLWAEVERSLAPVRELTRLWTADPQPIKLAEERHMELLRQDLRQLITQTAAQEDWERRSAHRHIAHDGIRDGLGQALEALRLAEKGLLLPLVEDEAGRARLFLDLVRWIPAQDGPVKLEHLAAAGQARARDLADALIADLAPHLTGDTAMRERVIADVVQAAAWEAGRPDRDAVRIGCWGIQLGVETHAADICEQALGMRYLPLPSKEDRALVKPLRAAMRTLRQRLDAEGGPAPRELRLGDLPPEGQTAIRQAGERLLALHATVVRTLEDAARRQAVRSGKDPEEALARLHERMADEASAGVFKAAVGTVCRPRIEAIKSERQALHAQVRGRLSDTLRDAMRNYRDLARDGRQPRTPEESLAQAVGALEPMRAYAANVPEPVEYRQALDAQKAALRELERLRRSEATGVSDKEAALERAVQRMSAEQAVLATRALAAMSEQRGEAETARHLYGRADAMVNARLDNAEREALTAQGKARGETERTLRDLYRRERQQLEAEIYVRHAGGQETAPHEERLVRLLDREVRSVEGRLTIAKEQGRDIGPLANERERLLAQRADPRGRIALQATVPDTQEQARRIADGILRTYFEREATAIRVNAERREALRTSNQARIAQAGEDAYKRLRDQVADAVVRQAARVEQGQRNPLGEGLVGQAAQQLWHNILRAIRQTKQRERELDREAAREESERKRREARERGLDRL